MSNESLEWILGELRGVPVEQDRIRKLVRFYDTLQVEVQQRYLDVGLHMTKMQFYLKTHSEVRKCLRPTIDLIKEQYRKEEVLE